MTLLIVNVEDINLLADLKEAILLLRGVASVTEWIDTNGNDAIVNSISKKCGLDEALEDVKEGRVSEYASVDDFFREIKV